MTDHQLLKLPVAPLQEFCFQSYLLGGIRVDLTSNDDLLPGEVASTLGDPLREPVEATVLRATFRSGAVDAEHGLLELHADDRDALTADDLLLGLDSPGFPFRLSSPFADGWMSFAFMADERPLLSFRGSECLVWQRDRWRAAIGFLLLHRIYRLRRDAIFFHASSVDLGGGVMFVGPKGAGKSTTSLALAARNVPLLGDEIACYRPADGMLEPFRRPVGIKPGPRSSRINESLRRIGVNADDEIVRIDPRRLISGGDPASVPLRTIVFLDGFAPEPRLTVVDSARESVRLLQPVVSSLVSAPRTQRVFEMARMVSSARICHLSPGDPDATAEMICRAFEGAGR